MDTKEALQSFDLDPRLLYDAIAFSTDDYLYIIDMKTDTAVVLSLIHISEPTRH